MRTQNLKSQPPLPACFTLTLLFFSSGYHSFLTHLEWAQTQCCYPSEQVLSCLPLAFYFSQVQTGGTSVERGLRCPLPSLASLLESLPWYSFGVGYNLRCAGWDSYILIFFGLVQKTWEASIPHAYPVCVCVCVCVCPRAQRVSALPLSGTKIQKEWIHDSSKIFFTWCAALRSDDHFTWALIVSYLHVEYIYIKNHCSLELCLSEREETAASMHNWNVRINVQLEASLHFSDILYFKKTALWHTTKTFHCGRIDGHPLQVADGSRDW